MSAESAKVHAFIETIQHLASQGNTDAYLVGAGVCLGLAVAKHRFGADVPPDATAATNVLIDQLSSLFAASARGVHG